MRTLLGRFAGLFRRRLRDAQLDDEVRAHLELLTADYERRGMTPDDARYAARRAFGGVEPMKERYRERRGLPWLDDARRDVGYALRMFGRNPLFAGIAVLTLALGIGANAAIFSLADGLLLKRLPIHEPDRLVRLVDGERLDFTYPDFTAIQDRSRAFAAVIGVTGSTRMSRIEVDEQRRPAVVHGVSANYFDVLGISAIHGRVFERASTTPDDAVISASYWRRQYAENPAALGSRFRHANREFTIAGIAQADFTGTTVDYPADVWVRLDATNPPGALVWTRGRWVQILARLQLGIGEAAAASEASAVVGRGIGVEAAGTGNFALRARFTRPVLLLAALAALVLLIACANLANLMFARSASRARELWLRSAVGASRGRLARQLLTESLLLSAIGGLAAIVVASWTSNALLGLLPADALLAREQLTLRMNGRLAGFIAAAALGSGLLFGLGPAMRIGRRAAAGRLAMAFRNRSAERRASDGLVFSQVALCVLLLTAAALCVRTLWNLRTLDAGFVRQDALVADVEPPAELENPQRREFVEQLRQQLAAQPGIRAAAFSQVGQLSGNAIEYTVTVPGLAPTPPATAIEQRVSPGFLEAMGTPLVAGRPFDERDRAGAVPVAIVNESFVRRFLPGRRVLGERFTTDEPRVGDIEIVGVAKDTNWFSLREPPTPMYYRPFAQTSASAVRVRFAVRASGDLDDVAAMLVRTTRALGGRAVVENVTPLTEVVDQSLARERMAAYVSIVFGLLAALIACVGVYGVLSHDVTQRTGEMAIRAALGATRRQVLRSILGPGFVPAGLGIVAGLSAAAATAGYLETLLFGVSPLDPWTYLLVGAGFTALTSIASYVPARRATRVDPAVILRSE